MLTLVIVGVLVVGGFIWADHSTGSEGYRKAAASANQLIGGVVLPTGARQVSHFTPQRSIPAGPASTCNPMVRRTKYWTVPGNVDGVISFVRAHPSLGSPGDETGGYLGSAASPTAQYELEGLPGLNLSESLTVVAAPVGDGLVGIRADALVAEFACGPARL